MISAQLFCAFSFVTKAPSPGLKAFANVPWGTGSFSGIHSRWVVMEWLSFKHRERGGVPYALQSRIIIMELVLVRVFLPRFVLPCSLDTHRLFLCLSLSCFLLCPHCRPSLQAGGFGFCFCFLSPFRNTNVLHSHKRI